MQFTKKRNRAFDALLRFYMRQEKGKRYIVLSIGQKPSMLSIIMENSTDGKLSERDGVFLSSKAEGRI